VCWQVFVAGATGNTGRRVVQQLRAAGYKVKAGVRVSGGSASSALAITHPRLSTRKSTCTL
jgi:uncharacterized protein YbjT (DUF2867 family)